MSVLEKCRQLPHKQPEPQRVHTHSTGSAVRDPLGNNLSQGQCYQNNFNFTTSTSLNMSAGFTHSYNAASYSTIGRKTSCSLPESPSSQPSRDSRLHILRELTRDIDVFNPETSDNNIELYLKDVSAALTYFPQASMADKVFLLRKTTARTVHGFIDRQSPAIANSYDKLCKSLLSEYTLYQNPSASRLSFLN